MLQFAAAPTVGRLCRLPRRRGITVGQADAFGIELAEALQPYNVTGLCAARKRIMCDYV